MKIVEDLQAAYDHNRKLARAGNQQHFIVYLIERISRLEERPDRTMMSDATMRDEMRKI